MIKNLQVDVLLLFSDRYGGLFSLFLPFFLSLSYAHV
jgi:hypothetical protein